MADIFGKRPDDYAYIRHLHKRSEWDAYQAHYATENPGSTPKHDFDAFGAGVPDEYKRAQGNAQALGYLTNNLLAVQAQVDEILYTKFRLPSFVHLNMSLPEGTTQEGYQIRIKDRTGKARRITSDGWDAPSATVSRDAVNHPLFWYGLDAIWSVDELRGAMMGGVPLDTENIDAAVEGSLEKMEEVGLLGEHGWKGLTNLASGSQADRVNASNAAAKWDASATTAEQIRDNIANEVSKVIENSKEVLGTKITSGLCVYLSGPRYDLLTYKYIGDNQERTIMRALKEDNPWSHFTENETGTRQPLMFKRVLELAAANNPDLSNDRMITMLKHERIAEMGVAIMPRVLEIINEGRVVRAQVESKYSPLFVKRPKTIYYLNNI